LVMVLRPQKLFFRNSASFPYDRCICRPLIPPASLASAAFFVLFHSCFPVRRAKPFYPHLLAILLFPPPAPAAFPQNGFFFGGSLPLLKSDLCLKSDRGVPVFSFLEPSRHKWNSKRSCALPVFYDLPFIKILRMRASPPL